MSMHPTRRALFGAPLVAIAALPAAPHPDADLIAACAEFHRLHRLWNDEGDKLTDEDFEPLTDAHEELLESLAGWDPKTPEGLRAKAGVGFSVLLWRVDAITSLHWREQADAWDIVAIEALRDISGMQEPVKVLRPAKQRSTVDQALAGEG